MPHIFTFELGCVTLPEAINDYKSYIKVNILHLLKLISQKYMTSVSVKKFE